MFAISTVLKKLSCPTMHEQMREKFNGFYTVLHSSYGTREEGFHY